MASREHKVGHVIPNFIAFSYSLYWNDAQGSTKGISVVHNSISVLSWSSVLRELKSTFVARLSVQIENKRLSRHMSPLIKNKGVFLALSDFSSSPATYFHPLSLLWRSHCLDESSLFKICFSVGSKIENADLIGCPEPTLARKSRKGPTINDCHPKPQMCLLVIDSV